MITFTKRSLPQIFGVAIFLLAWLYTPTSSYFSQDDFFHLRTIYQKSFLDIPSFFMGVSSEYGFYRPLPRETFNLLMFKSFGLDPLPFHIINLVLIIINFFVVFFLIKELINYFSAVLTATLYLTSSVHSIELYYLSSVQLLAATLFLSLSAFFFLKFLKGKSLNSYLLSFFSYLLALLCHEMAIIQPSILLLLYFFIFKGKEQSFYGIIFKLTPFALFSLLHFLFILSTSLPRQQAYLPSLNIKDMVNNLGWYSLWSFGLPESLIDFVGPGFRINTNFFKWFTEYSLTVFSLFGLMMFLLISCFLLQRKKLPIKSIVLLLCLFVFSLSPFLLFPQHKFVYYLSFGVIWFCTLLSSIIIFFWKSNRVSRILAVIIIGCYLVISYLTIQFYEMTYWAAKRAAAAKILLQDIKQLYPTVERSTVFYIVDDLSYPSITKEWGTSSKQAFYILSGSDALKLLYDNHSIETYYQGMGGLPDNIGNKRIIHYVAKFPY